MRNEEKELKPILKEIVTLDDDRVIRLFFHYTTYTYDKCDKMTSKTYQSGKIMRKIAVIYAVVMGIFLGCSTDTSDTENPNNDSETSNITLYNAYGNSQQLLVHGRTVKEEESVSTSDSGYSNVWNAINFFHNDEIPNKNVFLWIDNKRYETKSDSEGYFAFDINTSKSLNMGYKNINVQIENNLHIHHAKATIISDTKMVGIISDIDDTVIVSDVTNKTELILNTFWKNYKQRKVVPTMVERFQEILAKNPPASPSRLFFISGSPKQLYTPIEKFLSYNHFPEHVLILKQIHGDNKDSLFNQIAFKTSKIERLIALYPQMQWVMFGDSGESDLAVYRGIKEKYPSNVKAYYIRDVDSGVIEQIE